MRFRTLLLATVGFGLISVAYGSPCFTGSLADYELLGSDGCTIGAVTVGSFTTLSGITGAMPFDPTTVSVTPGGGTDNPQLMFQVNQATSTAVLEAIFNYTISGPAFTMDTITLSGSMETPDGAVTDTQNYCAGGQFGPDGVTGCTGSDSETLLTFDNIQNTDQSAIAGVTSLSITDDFVLDPGMSGSASGGTFVDQYTATSTVPEPGTYALLLCGAALFAFNRWRRKT